MYYLVFQPILNNFEPLNHIILIAKKAIFYCRRKKNIVPSLNIFLAHFKNIIKIEGFLLNKKQITPALGKMEEFSRGINLRDSFRLCFICRFLVVITVYLLLTSATMYILLFAYFPRDC